MSSPRIVLFDIETAPNVSFTWGRWEQNVIDIKEDWYVLSFAYKTLNEKKITTRALPDFPAHKVLNQRDKHLVRALWEVIDGADILIAHNGDRFDIRKAKARFAALGLPPPKPFKSIDTLKIARRHFDFGSNKLDDLGRTLGVGRKLPHTGKHLWFGCMDDDPPSWKTMRKYNAEDVALLERVYLKLRAWEPNHPNLNVYTAGDNCPTCQSPKMQRRGVHVSKSRRYQRWKCNGCGAWTHGDLIL